MSVTTDVALEHPAKDARNARLHRKCNFCTSTGLFTGAFKFALADRTRGNAGLVHLLYYWVLAATVRAHDNGSRRSGHGRTQCLPRPKLAHRRSFKTNFILDVKQGVHYGATATFMFATSTG